MENINDALYISILVVILYFFIGIILAFSYALTEHVSIPKDKDRLIKFFKLIFFWPWKHKELLTK